MASYRRRLEQDLDRWVADGLVAAGKREAILATVPDERRMDAATALAVIGAFLAGAAVIAFIAANWGEIPRVVRFALVLAIFLGLAGGAAWAAARERPVLRNLLLSVAALVFGAAIGLTGQIFDIAGDPRAALRGAGLGAALLAVAGRSPWAAATALVFIALGDFASGFRDGAGWLAVAAPAGVALAIVWRSTALAQAAGLAMLAAVPSLHMETARDWQLVLLAASAVFAGLAAAARFLRPRLEVIGGVLYGWFSAGALLYFGAGGFGPVLSGVGHSVVWLAASAAVVALGRHDRHGLVTAAGVISIFAAGAALLLNLGVGLMTAAAVFGACAVAALVVAGLLRRRRAA